MLVRRGVVTVEWENIGEGRSGDYDDSDPDDIELLRFYVRRFEGDPSLACEALTDPALAARLEVEGLGWSDVEDASYCTNVPADTTIPTQMALLELLMDRFHDPVSAGASVKKLGQELSWIAPEWLDASSPAR